MRTSNKKIEKSSGPRRLVKDGELYFTDNGAILCGKHCGTSAAYTGRDISGQLIARVATADMHVWWANLHEPIHCERCGTFSHPLQNEDDADAIMLAMSGFAS